MENLLKQIIEFWQSQSQTRRITMIALLASAVILLVVFLVWANQPSYSVVYSGLSESDAGEIVSKLKEQGVTYRLKDSGTILVPTDQVYEVRLSMANEGLPKSSSVGYELFNSSGLIMTEFTQNVNYQRALEGELQRTINSISAVEESHVHIVIPEKALLTEDQQPATASVTLHIKQGEYLERSQVNSISHLVASSVQGLSTEQIVIIDGEGNLLAGGGEDENLVVATQNDVRRLAELTAAKNITKNVEDVLDKVIGPDRYVVQASVILDLDKVEVKKQEFSPDENSVRSSQNLQESYTTTEREQGVPGAETNLPEGAIVAGDENQLYNYSRSEDTVNYEINEVETTQVKTPGQISKISLAVMVDGVEDEEQLSKIEAAVSAAAGIDETRGDVLSVSTISFDRTYEEEQIAAKQQETAMETFFKFAEIFIPVLVVAALLFFLWRLFKNLRLSSEEAWTPIMQPVSEAALGEGAVAQSYIGPGERAGEEGAGPALEAGMEYAPEAEEEFEEKEEYILEEEEEEEMELPPALPPLPKVKPQVTPEDEQLIRVLTRMAEESPATVAEIIQLWLTEDE